MDPFISMYSYMYNDIPQALMMLMTSLRTQHCDN